jgi:hypothetical protein
MIETALLQYLENGPRSYDGCETILIESNLTDITCQELVDGECKR